MRIVPLLPSAIDSLELLAKRIHPQLFADWGPRAAWAPLDTTTVAALALS